MTDIKINNFFHQFKPKKQGNYSQKEVVEVLEKKANDIRPLFEKNIVFQIASEQNKSFF